MRRSMITVIACVLGLAGCTATGTTSGTSTFPVPPAASSMGNRTAAVARTIGLPVQSTAAPTSATSAGIRTSSSHAAVPMCAVVSSAPPIDPQTVTAAAHLAPDTCVPRYPSHSPGCVTSPVVVVSGGVTRPGSVDELEAKTGAGGFGRFGGRDGAAMCFSSYADHSLSLTNGAQVILVEPSLQPVIYIGRTALQRSPAVWGAVGPDVARVVVRDATHPTGVSSKLTQGNSTYAKFFVQPVGAGPITVNAFDAAAKITGTATTP